MNASQSMPSPISPYDGQSKQSFSAPRPYYPATPAPESVSPQQQQQQQQPVEPNRGLGLTYPGSMAPSHPPTISPVMPSPQSDWSQSQQQPQSSSAAPPDIFSAEFDPFSGFPATSNHGMVGSHSPEAPGLEFCHTPPSSNMQSHRGSVSSSCAPSEASDQAYTPRPMKGEETWYPVSSNQAPLQYPHGAVPLATHNDDIIYRPHPDWTKPDGAHFSDPQATQDGRLPPPLGMLASVTRQKKKRQRTTPEEATHECQVCGKLFKRSYNYKSHLDTHNPERKYPHPCTCMVGNSQCAKKFQRKTDLDRHVDSVHLKARNHKCHLCGNRFARRDTLRRHTEDGCPKRFELTMRDGQNAPSSAPQHPRHPFPSPVTDFDSRRSFGPNGSMPPPPPVSSSGYLYSTPAPFYR